VSAAITCDAFGVGFYSHHNQSARSLALDWIGYYFKLDQALLTSCRNRTRASPALAAAVSTTCWVS